MDDRFRFRVWNEPDSRFLYDEEIFISGSGYLHCNGIEAAEGDLLDRICREKKIHLHRVLALTEGPDPEFVVEQCTGLKDKNGKLIYEGDVVIYLGNRRVVSWQNNCSDPELCGFAMTMVVSSPAWGTHLPLCVRRAVQAKVIGNIHEGEYAKGD